VSRDMCQRYMRLPFVTLISMIIDAPRECYCNRFKAVATFFERDMRLPEAYATVIHIDIISVLSSQCVCACVYVCVSMLTRYDVLT
jgi:hypothetical protein